MHVAHLLSQTGHWLLHDSNVHSQPAHRHAFMGIILDQRRRRPGPNLPGRPDHSHNDHAEFWSASGFAQGIVCKGY